MGSTPLKVLSERPEVVEISVKLVRGKRLV